MTKEDVREILVSDLAKQWDTSESYIRSLCAKGKIRRTRRKYVNLDDAERYWRNRDPAHVAARATQKANGGMGGAPGKKKAEERKALKDAKRKAADENYVVQDGILMDARTREAVAKADLKEMEKQARAGELVSADEVRREVANVCRIMVASLQSLSRRMAFEVAGLNKPDEIGEAMDREVRIVIEDMRDNICKLS